MTKGRRIGFIAFSLLMIVCLVALGAWQLQRMQWKAQLIEQSKSALTAKPVSINDITAGIEYGFSVDWLRIELTGSYRHDLERYIYSPTKAGIGYQIITPFIDDAGILVFVDRGWVPATAKDLANRQPARQPENKIVITGVTRLHIPGTTLFQAQADRVNNVWYWYDRETLATSLPTGTGETTDGQLPIISPVFVQLEPNGEPGVGEWPKIGPVKIELPNNHLHYAITWLSLALITLVMLIIFLRANRKTKAAP